MSIFGYSEMNSGAGDPLDNTDKVAAIRERKEAARAARIIAKHHKEALAAEKKRLNEKKALDLRQRGLDKIEHATMDARERADQAIQSFDTQRQLNHTQWKANQAQARREWGERESEKQAEIYQLEDEIQSTELAIQEARAQNEATRLADEQKRLVARSTRLDKLKQQLGDIQAQRDRVDQEAQATKGLEAEAQAAYNDVFPGPIERAGSKVRDWINKLTSRFKRKGDDSE